MSWTVYYIVVEWSLRVVMVPVVARHQRANAALAWLAVIFAFPILGSTLYLILGEERLPRRRIARRRGRLERRPSPQATDHRATDLPEPIASMSRGLGRHPMVRGNVVQTIADKSQSLEALIAAIDAATHHVHLIFYIYADDAFGRQVADALYRAVERGVVCRLLADGVGSFGFHRKFAGQMRARGIHVQASLPVGIARLFLARLDLRNHRKLVVVDGRVAFTGSMNIVDADAGRHPKYWRDVMQRLEGPVVRHLQEVFVSDWLADTDETLDGVELWPPQEVAGEVTMQVVESGPLYPSEAFVHLVVAAIHLARERLVMTTPYFVPAEPLEVALQMAAARGVEIDLVVPATADFRIVSAAGRAYFGRLLRAGVRIHQHEHGMIHTKSVTVDDAYAIVGSGNLDLRSFYLDFELNLLLLGPAVTCEVREVQARYIAESRRIDPVAWMERPWWRWMPEHAAKLLSPLL